MGEDGIAVMLGLSGFRLLEVEEVDGELVPLVETTATVVGCGECGTRARAKDRRTVTLRDLPMGERPVRLRWRKRVWSCPEAECEVKTWTERSWLAEPRRVLTNRAAEEICVGVGRDIGSVAGQGRRFGVGWGCAWSAVERHGRPRVDDPERIRGTRKAGLDETSFRNRNRRTRRRFVTGVVDVTNGQLVDVFEGRDAADLRAWMRIMPEDWLGGIEVVSVDPHEGYRSAITKPDPVTGRRSPWAAATVVVDPFHVCRLGNQAVTKCRQRVQQETLGHRGWKGDPLYAVRRLLLVGAERLDTKGWKRLRAALDAGDRQDEVADAWTAKEHVRSVYLTDDPDEAIERLDTATDWCTTSAILEVQTLAKTLTRWRREILAHHTTGASNGPVEAVNLTLKQVKRAGRGFANFQNYRLRLLLAAGVTWHTPAVTRIRRHSPRLIA